jgi:hypothetical protein
VRLVVELRTGTRLLLDHPSGAWATLADDLLHGVFYRPVESPPGWGGTRYPPLPALQAGLAAGGLGVRVAGALLALIALVALVLGTWRFLEAVGVRRALALPAGMLVLAPVPVQTLLGLGRADLLASAFSVWGLVLAARAQGRTGDGGAGFLFGLACLAKWSVLAAAPRGMGAGCRWSFSVGRSLESCSSSHRPELPRTTFSMLTWQR